MLARTLSREGFLAFLESRDPNEVYNWMDYNECPAAQYAKAAGVWDAFGFEKDRTLKQQMLTEYSLLAHPTLDGRFANHGTYGVAAKRLRAMIYG